MLQKQQVLQDRYQLQELLGRDAGRETGCVAKIVR